MLIFVIKKNNYKRHLSKHLIWQRKQEPYHQSKHQISIFDYFD